MKTLAEKIAVMQAALDGKNIEYFDRFLNTWCKSGANHSPQNFTWDWFSNDYRVAVDPLEEALDIYMKTFEKCNTFAGLNADRKKALAAVLKHFNIIKD